MVNEPAAYARYEESLAISGELGEKWVIAAGLVELGEVVGRSKSSRGQRSYGEQRRPYATRSAYPSLSSNSLTMSARSWLCVSIWESEPWLPPGLRDEP